MRWVLIIILFIVSCAQLSAQFTYLNQITGGPADLTWQSTTNVEVVQDGYVVWGGGVYENGALYQFARKYNLYGDVIIENILFDDSAEYVLSGQTKTFQWNPYTETFVYIHGVNIFGENSNYTEGYLIEFDTNLDTVFTRRYNHYAPYTYPFIFRIEEDGYVVVGETGGILYSAGTFIMKLDFAGNILWSEIMQPLVYENIYRNNSILKLDDKYMISGYGQVDFEPFGLITFVDHNGENLETLISIDPTMERSLGFLEERLLNDDIVVVQKFSFEQYEDSGNPNVYWNLLRYGKYNEETEDIEGQIDYFNNYDNSQIGAVKMIAAVDGGVLTLGSRPGLYYNYIAWMLKLNSNLEQEWYQEYSYQTCNDCMNILYDVELTPDGGYVAAGSFVNLAVDPLQSTWLLKVDACGDVEWQGCSPVGIEEKDVRSFSVYPNPSAGRFMVETNGNRDILDWSVYNLAGQTVAVGSAPRDAQSLEIKLNLPSGLYALELVDADGKREYHKVQIVK